MYSIMGCVMIHVECGLGIEKITPNRWLCFKQERKSWMQATHSCAGGSLLIIDTSKTLNLVRIFSCARLPPSSLSSSPPLSLPLSPLPYSPPLSPPLLSYLPSSLISPFSPHFLCFYAHPVVMYFHLLFFSMPYQLFKWTLQCLAFFGKVSAYGFQFLKLASHKEKINNSDISAYGKHKKHIW